MKNYAVNHGTLITTYNYTQIIKDQSNQVSERVNIPFNSKKQEKGYQKVKSNIKQGRK